MCGLTGASGKTLDANAIKLMMIDNEARGIHSSGIATYRSGDSKFFLDKIGDRAMKLVNKSSVGKRLLKANEVIGHARYATMGAHSAENAHPYVFGKNNKKDIIIGTHNGWLLDKVKLPLKEEHHSFQTATEKFGYEPLAVDSMLIFKHIYETQDITSISEIEGAMALAFLKNKSLHLYRRKSKPLFTFRKDGSIYYSSRKESFLLAFGLERDSPLIKELEPNYIYIYKQGSFIKKIHVPEGEVDIELDQLPSEFFRKCSMKHWKKVDNNQHNNHNYWEDDFPPTGAMNGNSHINKALNSSRRISNGTTPENRLNKEVKNLLDPNPNRGSTFNIFDVELSDDYTLEFLGYPITKASTTHLKDKSLVANQSTIIVSLSDFNQDVLKGYRIGIKGINNLFSRTSLNGRAGIRVPQSFFKKSDSSELDLLIHPPANLSYVHEGNKYYPSAVYTIRVQVKNNQVREVSCSLPFQLSEIKQVELLQLKNTKKCISPRVKHFSIEGFTGITGSNSSNLFNESESSSCTSEELLSKVRQDPFVTRKMFMEEVDSENIDPIYTIESELEDLLLLIEVSLGSGTLNDITSAYTEVVTFVTKSYKDDIIRYFIAPLLIEVKNIVSKVANNPRTKLTSQASFLSSVGGIISAKIKEIVQFVDEVEAYQTRHQWNIYWKGED